MSKGRTLFLFSTLTVLVGVTAARGEGELDALNLQYDVKRAELVKPIRELQKNYQSQLEKLRDKVRSSGSLEKTKAVDVEIEGFRDGKAPPAADGFPELRRLQRIYATELTARHTTALRDLPPVVKAHKDKLQALQKTQTRQNNLEEAEKVKGALTKVDETLGITLPVKTLSNVRPTEPAVISTPGETKPFQKGESQFTNRDFVWGRIPEKYQEWTMIMKGGGDETKSVFTVKKPGLVYAVIGPSFEEEFKADGWKRVTELFGGPGGKQNYLVIEKPFEAGDYKISGKGWFTTRMLLPPSSQKK